MKRSITEKLAATYSPDGVLSIEKEAAFCGSILTRGDAEALEAVPNRTFQDCVTIAETYANFARKRISAWQDVTGFVVEISRGEWVVTILTGLGASSMDVDVAYIAWV